VKHFLKRALAVALAGACALAALAQAPAPAARPKIGLVLGGGGARGGAHMGVLEVLEEMRIPFDCVAGPSMGALVSGAYLAGVSPEEMKAKVKATDWGGMFDDSAGRESIGVRAKEIDDRFFSALEFGMSKEGLRYREGAVAGTKIKLFFNELVHADLGARNIEDLPLPLTLIATDIGSGERVSMRSGDLTTAMRAVVQRLEGAFTLLAVHADSPGVVVGARRNSPLVVGLGDGENFLASDVSALIAQTRRVIYLEDGDVDLGPYTH